MMGLVQILEIKTSNARVCPPEGGLDVYLVGSRFDGQRTDRSQSGHLSGAGGRVGRQPRASP